MKSWILVANASEAKLYQSENIRTKDLSLLEPFEHPASRDKGCDLISDRPGHYQTNHEARSAYEKSDPKEDEAMRFAKELANKLKEGNDKHDYEQLIIVASPHFYGLINKKINFSLNEFKHINKDYTHCTVAELTEHLRDHLFSL